jgi:hypothetical protein
MGSSAAQASRRISRLRVRSPPRESTIASSAARMSSRSKSDSCRRADSSCRRSRSRARSSPPVDASAASPHHRPKTARCSPSCAASPGSSGTVCRSSILKEISVTRDRQRIGSVAARRRIGLTAACRVRDEEVRRWGEPRGPGRERGCEGAGEGMRPRPKWRLRVSGGVQGHQDRARLGSGVSSLCFECTGMIRNPSLWSAAAKLGEPA